MSVTSSRRSLLSGLGVAAGVAGTAAVLGTPELAAARGPGLPAVIHGADWRVVRPGVAPGTLPPFGVPALPHGRLVDESGADIGSFEAAVLPSSGTGTHLHRLEFVDGTISAVGPATFDEATFAVVGGTGRYAGASGSYRLRQRPAPSSGTAAFALDVTTPEA